MARVVSEAFKSPRCYVYDRRMLLHCRNELVWAEWEVVLWRRRGHRWSRGPDNWHDWRLNLAGQKQLPISLEALSTEHQGSSIELELIITIRQIESKMEECHISKTTTLVNGQHISSVSTLFGQLVKYTNNGSEPGRFRQSHNACTCKQGNNKGAESK